MTEGLQVAGPYILIKKDRPITITDGGLIKTDGAAAVEEARRPVAKVVQIGSQIKDEDLTAKINDYVIFTVAAVHAAFEYRGDEYLIASPQACLCVVDNPREVRKF